MPDPLMPKNGLGMKVAYSPCRAATALRVVLKVTALSAVRSASAYSKSISCWPVATSWCAVSTLIPNASRSFIISLRTSVPRSSERSK